MISEKDFYSQFLAFENIDLQWSTCGICSVAMVISSFGKFSRYSNDKHALEPFMRDLIDKHRNGSKPMILRRYLSRSIPLRVTVGSKEMFPTLEQDEIFIGKEEEFTPVFTLSSGFDHRSSNKIFSEFLISANLVNPLSIEGIEETIHTKGYVLASIHSLRGRGSHIVVLQSIGQDDRGAYIELVDPAEKEFRFAVKRFDLDFFGKIYNGYGTVITGLMR